jgi:8-amino-7-oxononanoate synthase
MHDPLAWINEALDDLQRRGLRRQQATRLSEQSATVTIDGRELINFGSNDYLGLACDKRLSEAARAAAEREGWGSGASPLVSGRSASHAELERRLAEFEGTEAALVFPSGFAANAGIIPALVDEPDAIFGDAKNHASLIDGCRLSSAKRFIYPHCDCDALEQMVKGTGGFRRRLIVSDTLFSMDGDLALVARLAEIAERYDAMLMLDEAHATGVFGATGRGIHEQSFSRDAPAERALLRPSEKGRNEDALPPAPRTPHLASASHLRRPESSSSHIRVGTLSKALGTGGGFVCGSQSLIDWLANRARTYIFSTAQPPATSAAAIAALGIVQTEPHRRQQLLATAANLRERLAAQGWNIGNTASQIIPLIVGDADRAMHLASRLRDAGYFIPAIRPPSVPEGESLLRLSLCYHHGPEVVDALIENLARLR